MKRKLDTPESTGAAGRRQPQVSCDFCRRKKLKCDRGAPCSSCSVRRLACSNHAAPEPEKPFSAPSREHDPQLSDGPSVLARLTRLENAIFGNGTPNSVSMQAIEKEFDTSESTDVNMQQRSFKTQFPPAVTSEAPINNQLPAPNLTFKGCIKLPTRQEALDCFLAFNSSTFGFLPVMHGPTVHSMILNLYSDLESGAEPPRAAIAALLTSLAAASDVFSCTNSCDNGDLLSGDHEASTTTTSQWLQSTLSLLHECQISTAPVCLEEVQARVVLSYVLSNTEGTSPRYRYLHGTCVSLARELGLHVVDANTGSQSDGKSAKEVKRRLWWYIASTDWMLGFMGGPLDGTYSVHPRHMKVNEVRNLNDSDLDTEDEAFELPMSSFTHASGLIQRVRLAEVCRLAIDNRRPGSLDEDTTGIEGVAWLHGLFKNVLAELPSFFQPTAVTSLESSHASTHLQLQRDCLLMAIHTRWARLLRSYLLSKDSGGMVQMLRESCIMSAREAVCLAIRMLDASRGPWAVRTGVTVGHLFTSCTMLATVAGPSNGLIAADHKAAIQCDLRRAYRVLTATAESNPTAASVVLELTGVLRQYSVHDVADAGQSSSARMGSGSKSAGTVCGADGGVAETLTGDIGLEQNDLWTSMLNTMDSVEGWGDLFAGLDSYCGPA